MADEKTAGQTDAAGRAEQQVESEDSSSTGPGGESQPAAQGDVDGRLAEALAQVESYKDQALRAQAEAENTRRRASRDVENAHKYALENFAQQLLPVLDSLEKAVELATQAEAAEAEAIAEGVQLSLKMFHSVLEKAGIAQVDPLGEPFDPQQHEAMAMVPSPSAEPNSVIEVMQKGYTLNGRLVRAAMVIVSKAPEQAG
jgi:molecular chaperone GrpE